MLVEIFKESWAALGRNRTRSVLTMSGIAWGIMAVTLLLSYGSGLRSVLMYSFGSIRKRRGDLLAGNHERAGGRGTSGQGGEVSAGRCGMGEGAITAGKAGDA